MEDANETKDVQVSEPANKGLKSNALGFADALSIGLASTAPAYSLAAALGLLVVTAETQAPAVLLASFLPMFFITAAFYYMNRADPDCGTTFSWVTRAMGPWVGWMGGWAVCVTGVLVIGLLADVASRYTFLFVGWDAAADSKAGVTALAVLYIGVMTVISVIGIKLSARMQNVMILVQVLSLLLFAVVALIKVFGSTPPPTSLQPEALWFSPFAVEDTSALIAGLLIGVFIYWGWESSVNITEETENSTSTPGRAAVLSTIILLVTYLSVTTATIAYMGLETLKEYEDNEDVLARVAENVLGSPLDKVVVLAVLASALASTQTTILPTSRTSLSMARARAIPARLGDVHPRFLTPYVSTIAVGLLTTAWYVPLKFISENFLSDTVEALTLMIAFYYSLSGFACVLYYRRELLKSAKNFIFICIAPLLGATLLGCMFIGRMIVLSNPDNSDLGGSILGLGPPLVIGLGFLLLGAIFMVVWRLGGHKRFFGRRRETVPPETATVGAAPPPSR